MSTGIRSNVDGSKSYIQVGGTDVVTLGTQGIEVGSFKPGAIVANDLADGALIENSVNSIGYGSGAGGTVTQATSKSTAVTLNKPSGQITMNASSLAAGSSTSFVLSNTVIGNTDVVVVTIGGGVSNMNNYTITTYSTAGNVQIALRNVSAAALTEAVILTFAIIKGATL